MKYSEQLKSKEWKEFRLKILDRDCHKCRECSKTTYLQVHHDYYQDGKYAWEYPESALRTLCRGCHNKFHKKHTLQRGEKPKSFKIYEKYMEALFLLDKSQFGIFMYCCKNSHPNTNKISIVPQDKSDLATQLEVTKPTISKGIKRLVELKFLIGAKGVYLVNPMLTWKGDDIQRQKLLQSRNFEIFVPDFVG